MSDIRKRTGAKGTTYQVRYPSNTTKSGHAYKTFDTLKEARAFREDASARKGSNPLSSEIRTVAQGLDKWLDICKSEGRHGREPVTKFTLITYEYRSEIAKKYDWKKELHELVAPDIVEFRSWLLKNYSRDQSKKVLSSFHSMILEMITRGMLSHDVASGICINGSSRYTEPAVIPTIEDVKALLSAADRLSNSKNQQISSSWERYRPMMYLAADSGMRPQEYVVLSRASVKEDGVKVDRALEQGGYKISVTKTPAGRRFINLSQNTLDMINYYIENSSINNNHDLIFPTSTGHWQCIGNWRKNGFYNACYEAGLIKSVEIDGKLVEKPKYKPYDLRHFYASMLIEQRTNLKRIQKLMGHEDIQTTLNVYGHLIERAESAHEKHIGMLENL